MMNAVWNRLQTLPPVKEYEPEEIPTELLVQNSTGFTITNPEPGYYLVEAPWFPKVLKALMWRTTRRCNTCSGCWRRAACLRRCGSGESRRAILSVCMILSLSTFRKEQVWKC